VLSQADPQPRTTQPLGWINAWIKAVFAPRDHFRPLIHDTNGSMNRAYTWIACASAVIIMILVALIQQDALFDLEQIYGFPGLLCVVPLGALIGVLLFALITGITHGFAGLLGGKGTYDRLAYVYAAYSAPLLVLMTLLAYTGYLLPLILSLYMLVLNVLAIRAVHRLGWSRAALSALWLPGILLVALILILLQGSAAIRF
jgi:hypothetical protein